MCFYIIIYNLTIIYNMNLSNIPEDLLYKFKCPPVNCKTLKIWKYIIQENKDAIKKWYKKIIYTHNIECWDSLNMFVDESINIKYWDLSKINILNIYIIDNNMLSDFLFDSLVEINIIRNLVIRNNKFKSLPESFSNIKIGHNLDMSHNSLRSLPKNFDNIKIGNFLDLSNNKIKSLPKNFGNIKVGGYINLCRNKLRRLPYSMGFITVRTDLVLSNNKLKMLPDSFSNIKIGRNLVLHGNKLTELPNIK